MSTIGAEKDIRSDDFLQALRLKKSYWTCLSEALTENHKKGTVDDFLTAEIVRRADDQSEDAYYLRAVAPS